jgi:hypothetical protein
VDPSVAMKTYISSPCPSSNHTKNLCKDQPLVVASQSSVIPSVTRTLALWLEFLSISGSGFASGAHPHFLLLEGADP